MFRYYDKSPNLSVVMRFFLLFQKPLEHRNIYNLYKADALIYTDWISLGGDMPTIVNPLFSAWTTISPCIVEVVRYGIFIAAFYMMLLTVIFKSIFDFFG